MTVQETEKRPGIPAGLEQRLKDYQSGKKTSPQDIPFLSWVGSLAIEDLEEVLGKEEFELSLKEFLKKRPVEGVKITE